MAVYIVSWLSFVAFVSALRSAPNWTSTKLHPHDVSQFCGNINNRLIPEGLRVSGISDNNVMRVGNQSGDLRTKMQSDKQYHIDTHSDSKGITDNFCKSESAPGNGFEHFDSLRQESSNNIICPLVFAGPSGVGKGTIINLLMKKYPNLFGFSTSHTTRKPRDGEVNGIHYHFTEAESMEKSLNNGEFLEYAKVHGNYYGTSRKAVEEVIKSGKICILDIDIQGVKSVKLSILKCKYIFISPPSMDLLEDRLRKRGTESEENIIRRLKQASDEISYGELDGNFDSIITNNEVDIALSDIIKSLQDWYPHFDFCIEM